MHVPCFTWFHQDLGCAFQPQACWWLALGVTRLTGRISVSSHGIFVQTVKSSMPVSDSWMRTLVTSVALNELLAEVSLTKKIEIVTLSSFFSLVFARCEMNKFFPHLYASF